MTNFSFDRTNHDNATPTISVLSLNKNHGQYLEASIHSVLAQNFDDFEYILADGGSTDNSLEIINRHRFIRLLPGPDPSIEAALMKMYNTARGRYVMFTTSTDGYISRDWFGMTAATLDANPDISMVWGASIVLHGDGKLGPITYPRNFAAMPQKQAWFGRWITDRHHRASYLPELNYCIRRNILDDIFRSIEDFPVIKEIDPILKIHFGFNRLGYLPYYIPTIANFARYHANQTQYLPRQHDWNTRYMTALNQYRANLATGRDTHYFRDGTGQKIGQVSRAAVMAMDAKVRLRHVSRLITHGLWKRR